MSKWDLQLYSRADLSKARRKGQFLGIAQGAGAVMLIWLLFAAIGVLPMVLLVAGAGFFLFKRLSSVASRR